MRADLLVQQNHNGNKSRVDQLRRHLARGAPSLRGFERRSFQLAQVWPIVKGAPVPIRRPQSRQARIADGCIVRMLEGESDKYRGVSSPGHRCELATAESHFGWSTRQHEEHPQIAFGQSDPPQFTVHVSNSGREHRHAQRIHTRRTPLLSWYAFGRAVRLLRTAADRVFDRQGSMKWHRP